MAKKKPKKSSKKKPASKKGKAKTDMGKLPRLSRYQEIGMDHAMEIEEEAEESSSEEDVVESPNKEEDF